MVHAEQAEDLSGVAEGWKRARRRLERFGHKRPAYSFPAEWNDLKFLYDEVMKLRPRICLELGSGYSTVAIWQALLDVGEYGALLSLEANPF